MGLLILASAGAVLGWLVAMTTGAESTRAAWLRVAVGVGASVFAGLAVSDHSVWSGLDASALVTGIAAAFGGLSLVSLARGLHRS